MIKSYKYQNSKIDLNSLKKFVKLKNQTPKERMHKTA